MSEYGYIPEAPEQSFGNNKGIFNPKDIYDLTRADKYTNYGQLELIETQNITGVSSTTFSNLGDYNVHFLTVNDFQPIQNGTDLRIRFISNGTEYTGTTYQRALQYGTNGGTFAEEKSTTGTYLRATFNTGNATNEKTSSYTYFYNLLDTTKYNFTSHQIVNIGAGSHPEFYMAFGSGVQINAVSMDTIKLYNAYNNYEADVSLYGIRYS